jgi:hypothetical protein
MQTGYKVGIGDNVGKDLSDIFKSGSGGSVVTNYKTSDLLDLNTKFQPISLGIAPRPNNKKTGYKISDERDLCDLFAMEGDLPYETNCVRIVGNTLTFERGDYTVQNPPYIEFLQNATIEVTVIGGGGGGNLGALKVGGGVLDVCSGGAGGGGGTIVSNVNAVTGNRFIATIGAGANHQYNDFQKGNEGGPSIFELENTPNFMRSEGGGGAGGVDNASGNYEQYCLGGVGGTATSNLGTTTRYVVGGNGGEGTNWLDSKYSEYTTTDEKNNNYRLLYGNGKINPYGTSGGGGGGYLLPGINTPRVGQSGQLESGGIAIFSGIINDMIATSYGRGGGGMYNGFIPSLDQQSLKTGADGVVIVEII